MDLNDSTTTINRICANLCLFKSTLKCVVILIRLLNEKTRFIVLEGLKLFELSTCGQCGCENPLKLIDHIANYSNQVTNS